MTFRLDYILDALSEFEDEQVIKTYKSQSRSSYCIVK